VDDEKDNEKPWREDRQRYQARDALPIPSGQAFYAKTLRCAAGRYVGCMAQVGVLDVA